MPTDPTPTPREIALRLLGEWGLLLSVSPSSVTLERDITAALTAERAAREQAERERAVLLAEVRAGRKARDHQPPQIDTATVTVEAQRAILNAWAAEGVQRLRGYDTARAATDAVLGEVGRG